MERTDKPGARQRSHGQAAMEFLSVYGWAILIFIVAIAFFFWTGMFKGSDATASLCIMQGDMRCAGYALNTSGALILDLANNKPEAISVTAIRCTDEVNPSFNDSDNLTAPVTLQAGEHALISAADHYCYKTVSGTLIIASGELGSGYRGRVYLKYTELVSGLNRMTTGEVALKFENASVLLLGTAILSCPITINAPGNYRIPYDLHSNGTCITVNSGGSGTSINGNGYTITGDRTGFGAYLNITQNVTLSNIIVTNFSSGVILSSSSGNYLSGNTADANTFNGILLGSSNGNYLSGNTAANNGKSGIWVGSSINNNLANNIASNNTEDGIFLGSSSGNYLSGNTANNNAMSGFFLGSSNGNNLTSNNALYNAGWGIWVSASGCILLSNIASYNNRSGIEPGDNAIVLNNTASYNNENGILAIADTNTNVTNNTMRYNKNYGFEGSSSQVILSGNNMNPNNATTYDLNCTGVLFPTDGGGNLCRAQNGCNVTCH